MPSKWKKISNAYLPKGVMYVAGVEIPATEMDYEEEFVVLVEFDGKTLYSLDSVYSNLIKKSIRLTHYQLLEEPEHPDFETEEDSPEALLEEIDSYLDWYYDRENDNVSSEVAWAAGLLERVIYTHNVEEF